MSNDFFHKLKLSTNSQKKIVDYILGKNINLTKEEEREVDCFYFAMCLLLPKESFIKKVNQMGGYLNVFNSKHYIQELSNIFLVPEEIVDLRLATLFEKDKRSDKLKEFESAIITLRKMGVDTYDIINFVINVSSEQDKNAARLTLEQNK